MYGEARHADSRIGRMSSFSGKVFVQNAATQQWSGFHLGWDIEGLIVNAFAWAALAILTVMVCEWRQRGIPWHWLRFPMAVWIVLFLLASLLLWLNLRPVHHQDDFITKGWPLDYYLMDDPQNVNGLPQARGFHLAWLLINLCIAIAIAVSVATIAKRLFRYREGSKLSTRGTINSDLF